MPSCAENMILWNQTGGYRVADILIENEMSVNVW